MDIDIASMSATVRAVDDRSLLSPDILDAVVREVISRLDTRQRAEDARREDTGFWGSVREAGR